MIPKKQYKVCVCCGSSSGDSISNSKGDGANIATNPHISEAKLLGEFIAKNHYQMIYGGGNTGLMGKVMQSFLSHLPSANSNGNGNGANNIYSVTTEEFLTDYEKECLDSTQNKTQSNNANQYKEYIGEPQQEPEPEPDCVNVVVVGDFVERIEYFLGESDIFVVLGGGIGTLAELSAALCANKCEKLQKPIVIINTNGYWNNFIATLNNMINNEFENKLFSDDNLLYVVESVDELKEKWHKLTNITHK